MHFSLLPLVLFQLALLQDVPPTPPTPAGQEPAEVAPSPSDLRPPVEPAEPPAGDSGPPSTAASGAVPCPPVVECRPVCQPRSWRHRSPCRRMRQRCWR